MVVYPELKSHIPLKNLIRLSFVSIQDNKCTKVTLLLHNIPLSDIHLETYMMSFFNTELYFGNFLILQKKSSNYDTFSEVQYCNKLEVSVVIYYQYLEVCENLI